MEFCELNGSLGLRICNILKTQLDRQLVPCLYVELLCCSLGGLVAEPLDRRLSIFHVLHVCKKIMIVYFIYKEWSGKKSLGEHLNTLAKVFICLKLYFFSLFPDSTSPINPCDKPEAADKSSCVQLSSSLLALTLSITYCSISANAI